MLLAASIAGRCLINSELDVFQIPCLHKTLFGAVMAKAPANSRVTYLSDHFLLPLDKSK